MREAHSISSTPPNPFDMPLIRIQLIISHNSPRNFRLREMIVLKCSSSQFLPFSDRLHIITAMTVWAVSTEDSWCC